jgi:hypothetical protein
LVSVRAGDRVAGTAADTTVEATGCPAAVPVARAVLAMLPFSRSACVVV